MSMFGDMTAEQKQQQNINIEDMKSHIESNIESISYNILDNLGGTDAEALLGGSKNTLQNPETLVNFMSQISQNQLNRYQKLSSYVRVDPIQLG